MQLSTFVLLVIAVVCVNASANYFSTVTFLTSTCTGSTIGGSAYLIQCSPNGKFYSTYSCDANNNAALLNCTDAACTSCGVVQSYNSTCGPFHSVYGYQKCNNQSSVPSIPATGLWLQESFQGATCGTLSSVVWSPTSTCIPDPSGAADYSQATCGASSVSVSLFANAACTGTATSTSQITYACNSTASGSVKAVCPSASTTSSTSTSSTGSTGNHTTTSTSGTGTGSTSTSSAPALFVGSFVVVGAVIAAFL